jgi:hypothetical protein
MHDSHSLSDHYNLLYYNFNNKQQQQQQQQLLLLLLQYPLVQRLE